MQFNCLTCFIFSYYNLLLIYVMFNPLKKCSGTNGGIKSPTVKYCPVGSNKGIPNILMAQYNQLQAKEILLPAVTEAVRMFEVFHAVVNNNSVLFRGGHKCVL